MYANFMPPAEIVALHGIRKAIETDKVVLKGHLFENSTSDMGK